MRWLVLPTLIGTLCRQSRKWELVSRDGDRYWVSPRGQTQPFDVTIRYNSRFSSALFTCHFPIQFSLEKPPSGLFARLAMRSFELRYGAWVMAITDGSQAALMVMARIPRAALDVKIFNEVCGDITEEVRAFRKELHDRFQYDIGDPVRGQAAVRAGVPVPRNANGEIRYFT